jgi:homoserine dehydrogenase
VVEGTLNALTLETDMAKEITLIGKGAGSIETASAIIGDILYIRDHYGKRA